MVTRKYRPPNFGVIYEGFPIDLSPPLSFTTSKSGENFRDYWPQKRMRDFISDSIHFLKALREH